MKVNEETEEAPSPPRAAHQLWTSVLQTVSHFSHEGQLTEYLCWVHWKFQTKHSSNEPLKRLAAVLRHHCLWPQSGIAATSSKAVHRCMHRPHSQAPSPPMEAPEKASATVTKEKLLVWPPREHSQQSPVPCLRVEAMQPARMESMLQVPGETCSPLRLPVLCFTEVGGAWKREPKWHIMGKSSVCLLGTFSKRVLIFLGSVQGAAASKADHVSPVLLTKMQDNLIFPWARPSCAVAYHSLAQLNSDKKPKKGKRTFFKPWKLCPNEDSKTEHKIWQQLCTVMVRQAEQKETKKEFEGIIARDSKTNHKKFKYIRNRKLARESVGMEPLYSKAAYLITSQASYNEEGLLMPCLYGFLEAPAWTLCHTGCWTDESYLLQSSRALLMFPVNIIPASQKIPFSVQLNCFLCG